MKLQLALDLVDIPGAIELVKEVEEYIDVKRHKDRIDFFDEFAVFPVYQNSFY